MLELGAPEKHQKRIRLCEDIVFVNGRFQRRFFAWKYLEKRGVPQIETFQIGYQNEGEEPVTRNISWLGCAGYQIAFPGEKCRSYYMGSPGTPYEEWEYRTWHGKFNPSAYCFWEADRLAEKDPRLKYFVLNDRSEAMREIETFRRHPQSESLFKLGLGKLAMQERLYRLSPETTKALIRFISKNLEGVRKNQNLNAILGMMARNITVEKFMSDHRDRMIARDDYVKAQGIRLDEYVDYVCSARALGYDMKDKKHLFPRDFRKTWKAIKDEADAKKNEMISERIASVASRLSKFEGIYMGFRFVFPKDFRDFREQAETLGNCLISNEYYLRHAKGKCVIVFVYDGSGKRVGTADITGGRINQFTGNQRRGSWKPSELMQNAMDAWMANSFLPGYSGGRAAT